MYFGHYLLFPNSDDDTLIIGAKWVEFLECMFTCKIINAWMGHIHSGQCMCIFAYEIFGCACVHVRNSPWVGCSFSLSGTGFLSCLMTSQWTSLCCGILQTKERVSQIEYECSNHIRVYRKFPDVPEFSAAQDRMLVCGSYGLNPRCITVDIVSSYCHAYIGGGRGCAF